MNHKSVEYAQYKAQRIKELIPELNRSGISILDFGCGNGLMTNYLQEVFFEASVIGVDQSKEKVAQAQKQYPEIEFQTIKNGKLDFPDNYFDGVIAADVFHHVPLNKYKYWIQELMRILKPDGFFVLLELNPWNIVTHYRFEKNHLEKNAHMLSPKYAKELLQTYGTAKIYYLSSLLESIGFSIDWLPLGKIYIIVIKKNHFFL